MSGKSRRQKAESGRPEVTVRPTDLPRRSRSAQDRKSGLDLPMGYRRQRRRGILLMECLVYMSLWLVVLGLAFHFFYRAYAQSKHLTRNADETVRVLKAGERWRSDVRDSSNPPRWESRSGEAGEDFVVGSADEWIAYRCTSTNLMRRSAIDPVWREVMGGLSACAIHRDERAAVVSWRWEVELGSRVKEPSIQPRFSFQAVHQGNAKP